MSENTGNTPPDDQQPVYERRAPWVIHGIVSLVILTIAIGVVMALLGNKPSANRWGGDRPAPSVAVETRSLSTQSYDVWVDSYGTAEALTQTRLVSEINGRVISVSPKIRAGGSFKKGDQLAQLEDRDYRFEVDVAASAAAEAEVVYLQEVAQAEFAAQEWNETPKSEAARQLALRIPQVEAAKAALQAAKSRLEKAQLDLARTTIVAPFDGKVLTQMIDIGQVVTPSQAIAEIYSTDAVEVRLPIKIHDLEHLNLAENKVGTKVVLESEMGSQTYRWQGEIVRTEGAFDPATRMLYVVAQVYDPFINNTERPAIRVGQFVRAKVAGNSYDNVFVIPRRAVSQDFMVSIAQEGVLQKRQVVPIWTDSDSVVVAANDAASYNANAIDTGSRINAPLTTRDVLILTPTANLPNGTRVRSLNDQVPRERTAEQNRIAAEQQGQQSSGSVANQSASANSAQ